MRKAAFVRTTAQATLFVLVVLGIGISGFGYGEGKCPILLQETETMDIFIPENGTGGIHEVTCIHKLGVGMDMAGDGTFDVNIVKRFPKEVDLLLPGDGVIKTKDVRHMDRNIPYTLHNSDKHKGVRFELVDIPTIDTKGGTAEGACCGCDGSCGKACGVELVYRTTEILNTDKWAKVVYRVDSPKLALGAENEVVVNITIENRSLKDLTCIICIPGSRDDVSFNILEAPGFSKKSHKGDTVLVKPIGSAGGNINLRLSVNPKKAGKVFIGDLITVRGALSTLHYPRAQIDGDGREERTEKSTVSFIGRVVI